MPILSLCTFVQKMWLSLMHHISEGRVGTDYQTNRVQQDMLKSRRDQKYVIAWHVIKTDGANGVPDLL